jgi:hypothetical protein
MISKMKLGETKIIASAPAFKGKDENDYDFSFEKESWGITVRVKYKQSKPNKNGHIAPIGVANFETKGKNIWPRTLWVQPEHQRKGIANHLYELAEFYSKKKIIPGEVTSPEAKMMWDHPRTWGVKSPEFNVRKH